jgi:hypothetical protein
LDPRTNIYGTVVFQHEKAHDWREPINQHLKDLIKLSSFAFHQELGVLQEKLPSYFLKLGELKQRFANGDTKLCIAKEKKSNG